MTQLRTGMRGEGELPTALCEWLQKSLLVPSLDGYLARGGRERGLSRERVGCSNQGKGWKFWEAAFTPPHVPPLLAQASSAHSREAAEVGAPVHWDPRRAQKSHGAHSTWGPPLKG